MTSLRRVASVEDARALVELGAPEKLTTHGLLVLEAAAALLAQLRARGVTIDEALDPWSLFVESDSCFERIADSGPERLRRSVR